MKQCDQILSQIEGSGLLIELRIAVHRYHASRREFIHTRTLLVRALAAVARWIWLNARELFHDKWIWRKVLAVVPKALVPERLTLTRLARKLADLSVDESERVIFAHYIVALYGSPSSFVRHRLEEAFGKLSIEPRGFKFVRPYEDELVVREALRAVVEIAFSHPDNLGWVSAKVCEVAEMLEEARKRRMAGLSE